MTRATLELVERALKPFSHAEFDTERSDGDLVDFLDARTDECVGPEATIKDFRRVIEALAAIRAELAQETKSEAVRAQERVKVPTWEQAEAAVKSGTYSALERFVYENEPSGAPEHQFRVRLDASLKEVAIVVATAIRAELVQETDPQGWRSIESAPKDGTKILAFCPNRPHYKSGKPTPYVTTTWWRRGAVDEVGYVGWGEFNDAWLPTHWMPLPPIPTPKGGTGA